jgi:hypothetical protein
MVAPDSQYLANSVKHQKGIALLLSRESRESRDNILLPRSCPKLDYGALTGIPLYRAIQNMRG